MTDCRDACFCRSFCPKIVIRSFHADLLSLSGVDDVSGEQWWLLLFMLKLFVSDINKVISYNCSHFLCGFFGLAEIVVKLFLTDLLWIFSVIGEKGVAHVLLFVPSASSIKTQLN